MRFPPRHRRFCERNQALTEKRRADDEGATAKAVSDFLSDDLLGQANPNNQAGPNTKPDLDLTVRDGAWTVRPRASPANSRASHWWRRPSVKPSGMRTSIWVCTPRPWSKWSAPSRSGAASSAKSLRRRFRV